jgi:DNA-binding SARP family transcriptional activator
VSAAESERLWRDRVARDPHSFEAHLELARLYASRGAIRPALREYHTLRKLLDEGFSPSRMLRSAGARAGADAAITRSALAAFAAHRSEARARMAELRSLIRRNAHHRPTQADAVRP